MDDEKVLIHEMDTLRSELQHLKNCQVRYFLFSITGTGAVISLVAKYGDGYSAAYLAPLLVILPCWWIFFDKASTITRIVGYYRILEAMICGEEGHNYLGWERSLSKFREWQENNRFIPVFKRELTWEERRNRLLKLNTAHKYWVINWYTFLALSLACILASLFLAEQSNIVISFVASAFVFVSAWVNLRVVS